MTTIFIELKIGIFTIMATYALLTKMYDEKKRLKNEYFFYFTKKKMKITLAFLPFIPVRF